MNTSSRFISTGTLVIALLVTSGCIDPLDSRYGVTEPGSINGCSVLHEVFKGRTNLRDADLIGPRLEEDGDLLIHIAKQRSLPDDEACEWLETWLTAQDGRQAVLVLRGGNLTNWLCHRWADQARQEAQRAPTTEATVLEELARRLEQRSTVDDKDGSFGSDDLDCPLFRITRSEPVVPTAINGLGLSKVPLAMRVTGSLSVNDDVKPEAEKKAAYPTVESDDDQDDVKRPTSARKKIVLLERLITLSNTTGSRGVEAATGEIPWAVAIPYGDSRLVVVLDALPLLDGAQPDPAARALLTTLVDEVTSFHDDNPHTTWVRWLRNRGEGGPPNPLLAVLTSPPISYMSWHFVVFLVVLALAGAAWLGRREAPSETRHDRFSRHVLALATRLRDGAYAAWCARAIARAALRHRQPPPALLNDDEARRWLLSLTDAADKHPPTPPPSAATRGSHDHPDSTDS